MSTEELTYEWVVTEDGDPRSVTLYRGSDEETARARFAAIKTVSGWGGTLTRRLVGPVELIAEAR